MSPNTLDSLSLRMQPLDRLFMAAVVTLMFTISGLTLAFTSDAPVAPAADQAPISAS